MIAEVLFSIGIFALGVFVVWKLRTKRPSVENVGYADLEMQAANQQARETLPMFWKQFSESPGGPADYVVCVMCGTPDGVNETVWVGALQRDADQIKGQLANEPRRMPGQHLHSPVTFDEDQIIDWAYVDGGKQYGHFALRVLAQRNPKNAAASIQNLWATPLPPEEMRT